mmetsp:Transcript_15353/g.42596  ORF Transcript_15353/g.42596 Transcript_15353/m.42596 type:complete len:271 (-) Transcript_15353:191-1003(-)
MNRCRSFRWCPPMPMPLLLPPGLDSPTMAVADGGSRRGDEAERPWPARVPDRATETPGSDRRPSRRRYRHHCSCSCPFPPLAGSPSGLALAFSLVLLAFAFAFALFLAHTPQTTVCRVSPRLDPHRFRARRPRSPRTVPSGRPSRSFRRLEPPPNWPAFAPIFAFGPPQDPASPPAAGWPGPGPVVRTTTTPPGIHRCRCWNNYSLFCIRIRVRVRRLPKRIHLKPPPPPPDHGAFLPGCDCPRHFRPWHRSFPVQCPRGDPSRSLDGFP